MTVLEKFLQELYDHLSALVQSGDAEKATSAASDAIANDAGKNRERHQGHGVRICSCPSKSFRPGLRCGTCISVSGESSQEVSDSLSFRRRGLWARLERQ